MRGYIGEEVEFGRFRGGDFVGGSGGGIDSTDEGWEFEFVDYETEGWFWLGESMGLEENC